MKIYEYVQHINKCGNVETGHYFLYLFVSKFIKSLYRPP